MPTRTWSLPKMAQHENKPRKTKDHDMKIVVCILHGHRQVSIQCPKMKTKVTSKQLQQVQIVKKNNTWAHADLKLLNWSVHVQNKILSYPRMVCHQSWSLDVNWVHWCCAVFALLQWVLPLQTCQPHNPWLGLKAELCQCSSSLWRISPVWQPLFD